MCGGSLFSFAPFNTKSGPGGLPIHLPAAAPLKPMSPKSLLSKAVTDNKAFLSDPKQSIGLKDTLGG